MASTADIFNGMIMEHKGRRMKVVYFLHVKPGKGGAFIRTKLKDIVTGQVIEDTFRSGEKIVQLRVDIRKMQYLFRDQDLLVFMDSETFEQISVSPKSIEDESHFLKEGMNVEISFVRNEVIGIELPTFVDLTITETEPGFRGNTASSVLKPARMETGFSVDVPLFVNTGDIIKIDTRTGEYVERVK